MRWQALLCLLFASAAQAADCPDPSTAMLDTSMALATLKLAEAEVYLDVFRDGVACSSLLSPEQSSHYFQAQAILLDRQATSPDLQPEESARIKASAQLAMRSAHHIAPDAWNLDLGAGEAQQWFNNAPPLADAKVRIRFTNLEPEEWVAFDGTVMGKPHIVQPGVHLLQVGPVGGVARFGREFEAIEGKAIEIGLPLVGAVDSDWRSATVTLSSPVTPQQRRFRRLLGGLLTGGGGVVLYGGAVATRSTYDNNPTDGLRVSVNGLLVASAIAGTAGAALFGLGLGTGRTAHTN